MLHYLERTTGYSRQQLTRLVAQHLHAPKTHMARFNAFQLVLDSFYRNDLWLTSVARKYYWQKRVLVMPRCYTESY